MHEVRDVWDAIYPELVIAEQHGKISFDLAKLDRVMAGGANINHKMGAWTPIFYASCFAFPNDCKEALQPFVPAHQPDRDAYIAALAHSYNLVTLQKLIDYKASLNVVDQDGYTPLFYAVKENRLEIVKCLLHAGASITDPVRQCDSFIDERIPIYFEQQRLDRMVEQPDIDDELVIL